MSSEDTAGAKGGTIMLIGSDEKQVLERRFQAAGAQVTHVSDGAAALERARHKLFDAAVLVSKGSLINVAETVFNLRDLNRSMPIIILVDRMGRQTHRFLRQLLEHPIEGTRIVTRRQLQKQLPGMLAPPPEYPR
jgi:CheY-like chemotaxis protein